MINVVDPLLTLKGLKAIFRRNERELFELHDQTGADALQLASVGLSLPMEELFEGLSAAD